MLKRNLLLSNIPAGERRRVERFLEPVSVELREVLQEEDKPITYVYFPLDFVGSTVIKMQDGGTVEIGVTGNEGLVGIQLFLMEETTATTTFAQIPGEGLRMKAGDFKKHVIDQGGPLHGLLHRYTHAYLSQVSQTAACNRLHPLDQRLCRWVLMTHNRVQRDEFPITQEFIGQMLGVARPTVSTTAKMLMQAGLIGYSRGRMKVIDRKGLEDGSCECYRIIVGQFDRVYGETWAPHQE